MAIEKVHDLKRTKIGHNTIVAEVAELCNGALGASSITINKSIRVDVYSRSDIKASRGKRILVVGGGCDASCHTLAGILVAGLASASTFVFNHMHC